MLLSRSSYNNNHARAPSPPLSDGEQGRRLPANRSPNTIAESTRPPSKPVAVPQRPKTPTASTTHAMPLFGRKPVKSTRPRPCPTNPSAHDPNAISPAVAALLAVTAIPPRRSTRRKQSDSRKVSIDELVNEWKHDETLRSSNLGTSPVLGMLLEETDDTPDDSSVSGKNSFIDEDEHPRSVSCDSVPSLDVDDMSLLSMRSPSTPGSLRSRRSISLFRKPRSLPDIEPCFSHPLASPPIESSDFDLPGSLLTSPKGTKNGTRVRSSFKSNLTTSLQALKNAALSSISSLALTGTTPVIQASRSVAPFPDDMLWSHPFLFPRLSSEVRPVIDGLPTEAERHYLNPTPLSFEEQEAPFQQALHAPYLAEAVDDAPFIPMQTYNRTRRKNSTKRRHSASSPDPQSEAGRALLGAAGVRQREVRENSDFLRVVVLEMNMRRQGKIESGRAKIWLPPRKTLACQAEAEASPVPPRWVGVSAY